MSQNIFRSCWLLSLVGVFCNQIVSAKTHDLQSLYIKKCSFQAVFPWLICRDHKAKMVIATMLRSNTTFYRFESFLQFFSHSKSFNSSPPFFIFFIDQIGSLFSYRFLVFSENGTKSRSHYSSLNFICKNYNSYFKNK